MIADFRKILLLLGFITIYLNSILYSQEIISFENLTSEEGLSQNSVYAIVEDKNGFIWLGTREGLNKYDGYSFTHFVNEPFNKNSLSNNFISAVVKDKDGNFYIGTQNGLNKFNLDTESFRRIHLKSFPPNEVLQVNCLLYDKHDNLWIGIGTEVIKYNTLTEEEFVYKDTFEDSWIFSFFLDSNNNIWCASNRLIYKYDMSEDNFIEVPSKKQYLDTMLHGGFYEDKDGRIWTGSDKEPYILDDTGIFVHIGTYFDWMKDFKFPGTFTVSGMKDGKVWVGSRGKGLCLIDLNSKTYQIRDWLSISPDDYGTNNITTITFDKSNRFWGGTNGGGLIFWNPHKIKFNLLEHRRWEIKNISIRALYKDKNDVLWIGGYMGLDKYDPARNKFRNFRKTNPDEQGLVGNTVRAIARDPLNENCLLIGDEADGLSIFNKNTFYSERIKEGDSKYRWFRNGHIYHIYIDSRENIWIATTGGLYRLDKNRNFISWYHQNAEEPYKLSDDIIVHIMEDLEGNIWAATQRQGVNKINLNRNIVTLYTNDPDNSNSIISNATYCLAQDGFGYIWIGTDAGIVKYNPQTDSFNFFNTSDGLSNNTVYGILIDKYNNLWLSTNSGLSKFDPSTGIFNNFDTKYNLQDKEFNSGAFYEADDGEMFFGGIRGINHFYPEQVKESATFPKVVLTGFSLNNKTVGIGESIRNNVVLKKSISSTDSIILDYNQNTLSFEYAALEYFGNKNIHYAYKLENFENTWNTSGTRRFASYTHLSPGDYIFKVKSTNSEGVWSDDFISVYLLINPPFWLTWYAYVFYFLVVVAVAYYSVYSIRKNIRIKQLEIEREKEIIEKLKRVDKLKDHFLAQISHEIRTPINAIINFTGLLEEDFKDCSNDEINLAFEAINYDSQRIIRTIDLILDFSEIQSGTYVYRESVINIAEDVIDKLYAEHVLTAKKKGLSLKLSKNARKNLIRADLYSIKRIFLNLAENALKYTFEGEVEISTYDENEKIVVTVRDTGIGISEEYLPSLFDPFSQESQGYARKFEGNGLGLALVKKYCELNKAELSVDSKKNIGTTITVKFKNA